MSTELISAISPAAAVPVRKVDGAAYAASKHGLLGLMRTLAIETAKQGITVNAICPGPVRTRMNNLRVEHEARHLGKSVAELEATDAHRPPP